MNKNFASLERNCVLGSLGDYIIANINYRFYGIFLIFSHLPSHTYKPPKNFYVYVFVKTNILKQIFNINHINPSYNCASPPIRLFFVLEIISSIDYIECLIILCFFIYLKTKLNSLFPFQTLILKYYLSSNIRFNRHNRCQLL